MVFQQHLHAIATCYEALAYEPVRLVRCIELSRREFDELLHG